MLSWSQQISASGSITPAINKVNSWGLAVLCLLGTGCCLASFNYLCHHIELGAQAAGYSGDVADLQILDIRNGYTVEQVNKLMAAWGQQGRWLYLLIELIDVTIYCTCYRAFGVVLANTLSRGVMERWPSTRKVLVWFPALPIILAGIDLVEDGSQVAVILAYSVAEANGRAPPVGTWWPLLILLACTLNKFKWFYLQVLMVAGMAPMAVACLIAQVTSPSLAAAVKETKQE